MTADICCLDERAGDRKTGRDRRLRQEGQGLTGASGDFTKLPVRRQPYWIIRRGLVLVVFTERREDTNRIISARWASKTETALYVEYMEDDS